MPIIEDCRKYMPFFYPQTCMFTSCLGLSRLRARRIIAGAPRMGPCLLVRDWRTISLLAPSCGCCNTGQIHVIAVEKKTFTMLSRTVVLKHIHNAIRSKHTDIRSSMVCQRWLSCRIPNKTKVKFVVSYIIAHANDRPWKDL